MSKLSFKTFCIEFYSKHIQKPSPEVYELFRTSGLLEMLDTDYEDLHGMGMEALMQFFDEYIFQFEISVTVRIFFQLLFSS